MSTKIYIDLDSTLNNLETAWINHCEARMDRDVDDPPTTKQHLTHWSFFQDYYGQEIAMSFFETNPYEKITPIHYAADFIINLEIMGYQPIIISAHSGNRYDEAKWKREWIDDYFGDHLKLIVTRDKYKYTEGSILVDDSPKNCLMHIWHNNQPAYLFNHKGALPYANPLPYETYGNKLRYVTQYDQIIKDLKNEAK